MPDAESAAPDLIQPELELQRDGIEVYRWRLSTGDILIEVFTDGSIKVNGEALTRAPLSRHSR